MPPIDPPFEIAGLKILRYIIAIEEVQTSFRNLFLQFHIPFLRSTSAVNFTSEQSCNVISDIGRNRRFRATQSGAYFFRFRMLAAIDGMKNWSPCVSWPRRRSYSTAKVLEQIREAGAQVWTV